MKTFQGNGDSSALHRKIALNPFSEINFRISENLEFATFPDDHVNQWHSEWVEMRMYPSMEFNRREFGKTVGVVSAVAASGLILTPSMAAAAIDVSHKIKISGDLRTFTQRMALATAFVMLDVDREHFMEVLKEEYEEFAHDMEVLVSGDPKYHMEPEQNELVLEAINTVGIGWKVLGPALKDVVDTGVVDDAHFHKIEKVNVQVMALTDSLLHRIMTEYKESLPQGLAYQIDVAGVQRMLSQKMIKEAILVALEFEADKHHGMLLGSMQLYGFGLDKLNGKMLHNEVTLPQLAAPVKAELAKAEHCWVKLQPILNKLDTAHSASPAELVELAKEADLTMDIYSAMLALLLKEAEAV
ncbi:MAG: type IV pili methyl-accepting chemotaxis transducer N-terminal domain-containing protein [Pseudomonadota bacterium]